MNRFHWMSRLAAVAVLLALGGCVTAPKHLAYNHEEAASTKRIVVLSMRHSDIDLLIVNNPGYSFGLIGMAIAEANRAPKSHWLKDEVARDHFDHVVEFRAALTAAMSARGYELRWSDPVQLPDGAKDVAREQFGLRKAYGPVSDADAQLDVDFGFVGYAAAGSTDSAPYRPTVVVSARLVGADGKRVLFEDYIVYNSVFSFMDKPITIDPDDHYRYPEFNALHDAGPDAVKGLQVAFRAAAEELAKQL
jgi:hypothetical protein